MRKSPILVWTILGIVVFIMLGSGLGAWTIANSGPSISTTQRHLYDVLVLILQLAAGTFIALAGVVLSSGR